MIQDLGIQAVKPRFHQVGDEVVGQFLGAVYRNKNSMISKYVLVCEQYNHNHHDYYIPVIGEYKHGQTNCSTILQPQFQPEIAMVVSHW